MTAWTFTLALAASLAAVTAGPGGNQGQIWLDCDPGDQASGPGWQAGGRVCLPGPFGPDAVLAFDLILENRDNDVPQAAVHVYAAIHAATSADDLASVAFLGQAGPTVFVLADFGTSGYNPFDGGSGGNHNVYSGGDALWVDYDFGADNAPLAPNEIRALPVVVTLGPDPSPSFEMHFDAADLLSGAKTPDGHDATLINSGETGDDPPEACFTFAPGVTVPEGTEVTLDATCSTDDLGIVAYAWDLDTAVDTGGDGDPANDVDATGPVVTFTWYDDYASSVRLTVTDASGQVDTAAGSITIVNVPPSAPDGIVATFTFDIGCRMAGSKWSNIQCAVYRDYDAESATGTLLGAVEIERWPGSPDSNPTSTGSAFLTIAGSLSGGEELTAVVTYDPFPDVADLILGDQPNNGQDPFDNAGNPVWLIQRFGAGDCRSHHTFNTQQSILRDSDHWNHVEPWIVPLSTAPTPGAPIAFAAAAGDPGTDDVTFVWDWGDSTMTISPYLWDGVGPDPVGTPAEPYGSPWDTSGRTGSVPVTITDVQTHSYAAAGSYTVTLSLTDDDGGFSSVELPVTVAEGGLC
jgi:hypothetical protein